MSNIPLCTMMLLAAAVGFAFPARSEPLGVGTVSDARFQAAPDTDFVYDLSYFATKYDSAEAWKTRADALRQQVLASAGLLPFPDKTPLHPVVFGSLDRGDYIVEKVYLQSYPGVFVTGNLYRPKGEGPFPGVLNPHGHWNAGRLEDSSDCSVAGRCINFAKQGYVAFSYDMVGFVDAKQISHSLSGRRENLWGISLGGLQTWNSIRALDFLESLPYVDKSRIACTGASGGGTQTFLLSAIDDRVKVCAPVNMISVSMQGGCGCENMPNLRIDTNNVELGALMAPRPMI
ncbi:MAG: acetylxylan esterase, partial [Armatimonadetes bacterium]|nr:acetylxylan esterase [Armatimonadota bacterium]